MVGVGWPWGGGSLQTMYAKDTLSINHPSKGVTLALGANKV